MATIPVIYTNARNKRPRSPSSSSSERDTTRVVRPGLSANVPTPQRKALKATPSTGNSARRRRLSPRVVVKVRSQAKSQINRPQQASIRIEPRMPAWKRLGIELKSRHRPHEGFRPVPGTNFFRTSIAAIDSGYASSTDAPSHPNNLSRADKSLDAEVALDDSTDGAEDIVIDHNGALPHEQTTVGPVVIPLPTPDEIIPQESVREPGSQHAHVVGLRCRTRLSYREPTMSEAEDDEGVEDESDISDTYTPPRSGGEPDSDHETEQVLVPASPDDGLGVDREEDEFGIMVLEDEPVRKAKSWSEIFSNKTSTTGNESLKKSQKSSTLKGGIDLSLPPLSDIEGIFADMASRALDLGLDNALEQVRGRPLNVATMCSGTESPLIALELLSKALERDGKPPIPFNHRFSAEIEVVKQAFIQRNFQPPTLFRDVREFIPDKATKAITAYGAEEDIPGGIDILIAGFVCKDLSTLNNRGKALDIEKAEGETSDTFKAIYSYAKRFRPSIVLLENVVSRPQTWTTVVSLWAAAGYECTWLKLDTKNYYMPQTRQRVYVIAIKRSHFPGNVDKAVEEWKTLMGELQRQCSSPFDDFLSSDTSDQYEYSALEIERDWALCRLRSDRLRSEERLGFKRPVTRWSENGTVRPPDFANRKFFHSQSSRVYDCVDIAHLRGVSKGYDSLYKSAVFDVSQNPDYFKVDIGILSCITPSGCNFVSNRQAALTGSQMLLLQGMPNSRLLFARETQKDCQDLAGNAMTTTVIGASILAALIACWKAFRSTPGGSQATGRTQEKTAKLVTPEPMQRSTLLPPDLKEINLGELMKDAKLSSKLCNCEGTRKVSKCSIQVCAECGHTACSDCAGNPCHAYNGVIASDERKQTPGDFEKKWRPMFPSRLQFRNFPRLQAIKHSHGGKTWKAISQWVDDADINSQYFAMHKFQRLNRIWKISYESSQAPLGLLISDQVQWLLHVRCSATEPGNSSVRKTLAQPLARGLVQSSFLDPTWEMYMPSTERITLSIIGSPERRSSWRSRLGLPDYSAETVPLHLLIKGAANGIDLSGTYSLLADCGTAMSSLYKQATNGRPVYLFFDPDPNGDCQEDAFVFSYDCRRLSYGQKRVSLANLIPSWRPWEAKSGEASQVKAIVPGIRKPKNIGLHAASLSLDVGIPAPSSLARLGDDCLQAVTVLDIKLKEELDVQEFSRYAWALEHATKLPNFFKWQELHTSCQRQGRDCSPPFPRVRWNFDTVAGVATAYEDREAAAFFERTLKTRCPIFDIQSSSSPKGTHIEIGINISSLVHRAQSRLAAANIHTCKRSWRLATDHVNPAPERFPKFQLQSNSSDLPYAGSLHLEYELEEAQRQSLTWMRKQELGRGQELTVAEIEEAIHPELSWRAEAKAEAIVNVRGGVLADLPSFGKTVTTIALIHSEFEDYTAATILEQNKEIPTNLIDVAATLIVSPPHIARQWRSELKDWLGNVQYKLYNVRLVECFSDLQQLKEGDLRDCRVIIVSWSVFLDEEYVSQLARFSAMPPPASMKGRAFDAWLDHVSGDMGDRVQEFLHLSSAEFDDRIKALREKRQSHEDFKDFRTSVPIKIKHGSEYESWDAMQSAKTKKTPQARKRNSTLDSRIPLFEMFRFNRIVVDEYHYLYDAKNSDNFPACSAIKRLSALKRWVLSGTPTLANFSDVNQIASFLGLKLGRHVLEDGFATTALEKRLTTEQTDVERFLSSTEIMSYQWHQARHELAQHFLDKFVRQNEPLLERIDCSEGLRPIELSASHHLVYLEQSQHLISQRMQIKKLKKKSGSDQSDRLIECLNNSNSAEEALLKTALRFKMEKGESGLDLLIAKRESQRRSTVAELLRRAKHLKILCLQKLDSKKDDHYISFQEDMNDGHMLGDETARRIVHKSILQVERKSDCRQRTRNKTTSEKDFKELKVLASELRVTADELVRRVRSARFLTSARELLSAIAEDGKKSYTCSSSHCAESFDFSWFYVISHCGHIACESCLRGRPNNEVCVSEGCFVHVQNNDLIAASNLGRLEDDATEEQPVVSFGKKLDAVARLIKETPKDDQALVFVPNVDAAETMQSVFNTHAISYCTVDKGRGAAKILEDFKTAKGPHKKKVLMLNLTGESASGANLTNANHVIFVSPYLAKTQYDYESRMAQAIARCRRYKQKKTVHIYHFVALRTIDVDILEHRHRLSDAVQDSISSMQTPPVTATKEKSRLVRNAKGAMALVPTSWLVKQENLSMMEIEDVPNAYTSLISFSETFAGGDDV